VWFEWSDAQVIDLIRSEVDKHVPSNNCTLRTVAPCSFGICTCHLDCKDIKLDVCRGNQCQSFFWDGKASTVSAIANYLNTHARQRLPTSPRFGTQGVRHVDNNSFWAGNFYTRGTYLDQLARGVENESLRTGVSSARWATLSDALRAAPAAIVDPTRPDDSVYRQWLANGFGITSSQLDEVRANERVAAQVSALEVYPNALQLPAGKAAASWRTVTDSVQNSTALTSIHDLENRWNMLSSLIEDLNRSVERTNDAVLMNSVIDTNVAQLRSLQAWASTLRDAASNSSIDKQTTIDRLLEGQTALISLRDAMVSALCVAKAGWITSSCSNRRAAQAR